MSDSAAPENGPAPTPARAVYGFLLYVASVLAAAVYLTWALVPPSWLRALGLDYWPQQLWALAVPAALLTVLFMFVLVIYPLLGLLDAPGLDDPRVHTDEHSLAPRPTALGGIPPICDIPLSNMCRHLYMADDGDGSWEDPADSADDRWRERDAGRGGWTEWGRGQSERERAPDELGASWNERRLRSRSERGSRGRDEGGDGFGDVRWTGRRESWRSRPRRWHESSDGFSPGVDS